MATQFLGCNLQHFPPIYKSKVGLHHNRNICRTLRVTLNPKRYWQKTKRFQEDNNFPPFLLQPVMETREYVTVFQNSHMKTSNTSKINFSPVFEKYYLFIHVCISERKIEGFGQLGFQIDPPDNIQVHKTAITLGRYSTKLYRTAYNYLTTLILSDMYLAIELSVFK